MESSLNTPEFWLEWKRPADDERALWVGAATKDVGFSLTRLTFQITHKTDTDANEERDFLIAELTRIGIVKNVRSHEPSERIVAERVNRYITDGFVTVADLAVGLTGLERLPSTRNHLPPSSRA